MTDKIRRLVRSGKEDIKFLDAIYAADGDQPPGIFADSAEKIVFASMYYGYLVAKFGAGWEWHLK